MPPSPDPSPDATGIEARTIQAIAAELLDAAERRAERQVAWLRLAVGLLLLVVVAAVVLVVPDRDTRVLGQLAVGAATCVAVLLVGGLALVALHRGADVRRLALATTTADFVAILGNIAFDLFGSGAPGAFFAVFPPVWLVPIALAATALRYDPWLQAYAGTLYVAGLAALAASGAGLSLEERAGLLPSMAIGFGLPPNAVRLVMIATAAFVLMVVAQRGRRLLEAAVEETRARLGLTRFLPIELVPVLARREMGGRVSGRRQAVAVAFVDMRSSTRRAEVADPVRFAVFMSSFRRRITAAAAHHGGVIDKFIGDGALIVFGVPDPRPDDAARALAFAHDVQSRVARWNDKRQFTPPVSIGVGVHVGEVFCGLVGDERRLEFTVLGDVVNVAARLEKATKDLDAPIVASVDTLAAAGQPAGWRAAGTIALDGRTDPVAVMAPG